MNHADLFTVHDAAAAAGVAEGTIREWFHRGLLTRHGSARRALVDLDELATAVQAEKPRRQAKRLSA